MYLISYAGSNLEDFNALKNASIGYRVKKLEGFEVVFVGDLKPTPIWNVYRVYILMINIYLLWRFLGVGFRYSFLIEGFWYIGCIHLRYIYG